MPTPRFKKWFYKADFLGNAIAKLATRNPMEISRKIIEVSGIS